MTTKFKVGDRVALQPYPKYGWAEGVITQSFPTEQKWYGECAGDDHEYVFEEHMIKPLSFIEGAVEPSVSEAQARKNKPLARGCLDYFPDALMAVAELSRLGNQKHNPGEEMHHARGKSSDHADCIIRHLIDRGTVDPETGLSHSVAVAWRALALLQEEIEKKLPRGAR